MRGKQRAASVGFVQMLHRRPSNRQPVIGRGAAPDLVQNNQGPIIGLIQNRRRFDHFNHKGRPPPRQIVRGPNPAEQLTDQPDMRRFRRHKAARLRQQGDQRVLPQKRRFTRHIGPGQQPDRRRLLLGQRAIIRHESPATLPAQRAFNHWMPSALHHKGAARIDTRLAPVFGHRQVGETRRKVNLGKRTCRRTNWPRLRQNSVSKG